MGIWHASSAMLFLMFTMSSTYPLGRVGGVLLLHLVRPSAVYVLSRYGAHCTAQLVTGRCVLLKSKLVSDQVQQEDCLGYGQLVFAWLWAAGFCNCTAVCCAAAYGLQSAMCLSCQKKSSWPLAPYRHIRSPPFPIKLSQQRVPTTLCPTSTDACCVTASCTEL